LHIKHLKGHSESVEVFGLVWFGLAWKALNPVPSVSESVSKVGIELLRQLKICCWLIIMIILLVDIVSTILELQGLDFKGTFGIFMCPKMGLRVPESKNRDHFY
jgi:hypothetical protein